MTINSSINDFIEYLDKIHVYYTICRILQMVFVEFCKCPFAEFLFHSSSNAKKSHLTKWTSANRPFFSANWELFFSLQAIPGGVNHTWPYKTGFGLIFSEKSLNPST
jgi:hypothetical protein